MASAKPHVLVRRLARFGLTTPNAHQLSNFYQNALDFRLLGTERRSGGEFERLMGVDGGASVVTLGLGDEVVELLQFDRPGRLYPKDAASSDLCFQHFAIVVADINAAYQRLVSAGGWMAISTDGPQQLPASSGGVTAFKFRDPDGHPLELLEFPNDRMPPYWQSRPRAGVFLGIDHSAISVADGAASTEFYRGLGFRVSGHSFNSGTEQERLDAVRHVQVEVTALELQQGTPHVELLCYRSVTRGISSSVHGNDVAATRLMLHVDGSSAESVTPQGLIDPDGHRLVISIPTKGCSPIKALSNSGSSPAFVKPE
ncbi:VOC family protein [Bradyrhizobium sp.]|jgi:catechol 2,3-dioxygenase-like lactoylglutathione lyase family enzyme|uniref:VOC family protein n=1 Tax=Bradyrhizobium sp. TaxID=376 RepID=UPI003C29CF57